MATGPASPTWGARAGHRLGPWPCQRPRPASTTFIETRTRRGMRGVVVYTEVERRGVNPATIDETIRRGQVEFFPKLQAAPGFIGFYLVADEANATNTAIIVWESKADADAFDLVGEFWRRALDDLGHPLQSDNRGEVVIQLEPTK